MAIEPSTTPLMTHFEPETLALLRGLALKARYVVEGYLSGLHQSPFHGASTEFKEYREYYPGDDLRYLDWRVYARSDRLCVKLYTAETNTHVYMICDSSGSMAYRGERAWGSKFECSCILAAALSWLTLRQNDSVGLLSLREDDSAPKFLRPSQKAKQFGLIVRQLERLQPTGQAQLSTLLSLAAQFVHRRSIIVLLSDLMEPSEAIEESLSELRLRGHDCLIFQVLDRDELEFPFDKAAVFEDLETGARRRVSPRAAREKYLQRFESFMSGHRGMFESMEIPHYVVRTDDDPWQILAKFLTERERLK
ncbi:MAG: DUF58 domain-containing protein [Phycisphaerales bacterium]|nr:MAG: DUF58 domain-containing protein [Phycisphaerales bacterium]